MSALSYVISDTAVIAKRNLLRIPRQPDLWVSFTIQPIMFVLLFVYVFGGAIQTPGYDDYADFLMPGIIVQTMSFGGYLTAVPPESMPDWLEAFANVNPFTTVTDAMRALFVSGPAGHVWGAVAWSVGLVLVFAPLSGARYRRAVSL